MMTNHHYLQSQSKDLLSWFDNLIADNINEQIMQQRLTVDAIGPFPHIFLYITV